MKQIIFEKKQSTTIEFDTLQDHDLQYIGITSPGGSKFILIYNDSIWKIKDIINITNSIFYMKLNQSITNSIQYLHHQGYKIYMFNSAEELLAWTIEK